jgi:hypothetical protein
MAGGYFFVSPRSAVAIVLYMVIVYTTVGVFSISTAYSTDSGNFGIKYGAMDTVGNTRALYGASDENRTGPTGNDLWIQDNIPIIGWLLGGIQFVNDAIHMISQFFQLLASFLTFGIYPNPALPSLPLYVAWIPFLMVLPIWIMIIFWMAPLMVELLKAVADAITGII